MQRQQAPPSPDWESHLSTKFWVTLGQVAASCVAKLTTVSFRAPSTVTRFTRALLYKKIKSTYQGEWLSPKTKVDKMRSPIRNLNTPENSRSTGH